MCSKYYLCTLVISIAGHSDLKLEKRCNTIKIPKYLVKSPNKIDKLCKKNVCKSGCTIMPKINFYEIFPSLGRRPAAGSLEAAPIEKYFKKR